MHAEPKRHMARGKCVIMFQPTTMEVELIGGPHDGHRFTMRHFPDTTLRLTPHGRWRPLDAVPAAVGGGASIYQHRESLPRTATTPLRLRYHFVRLDARSHGARPRRPQWMAFVACVVVGWLLEPHGFPFVQP